jgi:hypothetical protein
MLRKPYNEVKDLCRCPHLILIGPTCMELYMTCRCLTILLIFIVIRNNPQYISFNITIHLHRLIRQHHRELQATYARATIGPLVQGLLPPRTPCVRVAITNLINASNVESEYCCIGSVHAEFMYAGCRRSAFFRKAGNKFLQRDGNRSICDAWR